MDYKETLHMPKTAFEMRGNLTKKEPGFQKRWQDEKLYEKMLERRKGAESFVLHDGPPYANGDIHLGHALNKVLKDVIVKSHFMEGYNTPYIPGWDTHGLPIETAVTKLGYDRKKMGIAEFRKTKSSRIKSLIKTARDNGMAVGEYLFELMAGDQDSIETLSFYLEE